MAVWEVCAAWGAVLSDAWLPRTLRHFMEEGIEEEAIERHCQQLLQMILAGAPLGISPSQPWPDFASDLRPPDHPGERVISNLKRFAGNYVTLLFTGAILVGCSVRPVFFALCVLLQGIAVFAPPEMFDVHVMQSKSAGGGFRSVGGAWLRYLLAVIAQIGFVCIALCGQRGAILASIVIFLHSLFRARPWTVMAKDRLKVH